MSKKNDKKMENINRYKKDYLTDDCKTAPLRMQIHLKK